MIAQTFQGPEVAWFALSPLLVLVGTALLLLLAGAMTPTWPKGLYALVTAVAAGAAGALSMVLWDDVTDERHVDARRRRAGTRPVRPVHHDHDLRGRRARRADERRLPPPRGARRTGGLRPAPRRRHRRDRDGRGQRPDRAVRRAGDAVAGVLRAVRQLPAQGRRGRERDQVLRARRVLVGVLPLRRRPRVRRHRVDEHLDDGGDGGRRRARRTQRRPRARRRGAAARRARLQDRRRAVPPVDARRVPGRADTGDRVHGVGRQGRRVRRPAAGVRRRPAVLPRRLATGGVAARRAVAGHRVRARRRADRRQADARLLVDLPRRVRARRCRGGGTPGRRSRQRARRARARSSTS